MLVFLPNQRSALFMRWMHHRNVEANINVTSDAWSSLTNLFHAAKTLLREHNCITVGLSRRIIPFGITFCWVFPKWRQKLYKMSFTKASRKVGSHIHRFAIHTSELPSQIPKCPRARSLFIFLTSSTIGLGLVA